MANIGCMSVSLKLQKRDGRVFEAAVKDAITLSRTPNEASKLSCCILRDEITAENGDILAMTLDDVHNQFYGYIFETTKHDSYCDIVAYDQLIFLANNTDTMSYSDITATDLTLRIVDDYELKTLDPPQMMDTGYKIPSRIEDNVTLLQMITTALDLTKDNTGDRFYLWDDFGALSLHSEEWLALTTSYATMDNIQDYSYVENTNDMKNRIKLSDNNEDEKERKVYTAEDEKSKAAYGFLQYSAKLETGENGDEKAKQLLSDKNKVSQKLSVSGMQGDIRVRGGTPVFVDLFSPTGVKREYIRGWFRTTSVTHKIDAGLHTMDLSLECIEMYTNWNDIGVGKP